MKTIEAVSNSIYARAKILGNITTVARKYFDAMTGYILGMNPAEHATITQRLVDMDDALQVLRDGISDVKLPTLHKIYGAFAIADKCAADFIALATNNEYAKASLMELSSGQHELMRADINRAIIMHGKYIAAGSDDDDIFDYALPITEKNHREYYNSLYSHPEPNKLTLELIRRLLPVVVGDDHLFVSELLAEQKRTITGAVRVNTGNWTEYYVGRLGGDDATFAPTNPLEGHERIIARYNCAPATVSMLPRDLFKTVGWRWDDTKSVDENFHAVGTSGVNVLLLIRTHGTPIEFNFRGVLDRAYAAKFPVKPYGGLCKNFLARYTTTTVLTDVSTASTRTNLSTDAITDASTKTGGGDDLGPGPSVRMYSTMVDNRFPVGFVVSRLNWEIVETLDRVHYRKLGCTLQGVAYADVTNRDIKTVRPEGTFTTDIPGSRILGLIMGPSTLPTEYNRIHSQRIRDMFDPMSPSHLSRYASYDKVVPASEPIKNGVVGWLEKWGRSNVAGVKNNRDWQNMFVSAEFVTAINSAISATMIKGSAIEKVKSPEYTITQIAKISVITAKFIRAIARAGEPIQERMFAEYDRSEIDRILIERFIGIIRRAADMLDTDKTWTGHELTLKEFLIAY